MTVTRQVRGLALRTLVLFALWMALVDTLHSAEVVAGAIAAPLCALLGAAAARDRVSAVRVRPALLLAVPAALLALFAETARVAVALPRALLGRPPSGRFRALRSGAGGTTPQDGGRRAMTEILGSVGPNRIVVGVDRESGDMLVHELLPSGRPLDPLEGR